MTSFTEAYKEALVSAPSNVVVLETLEIIHPNFPGALPIRLVNGFENVDATLEATAPVNPSESVTFTAGFFKFVPPKKTTSGYTPARLAIGSVGDVLSYIELTRGSGVAINVIYRPYLSTDTTAPQVDPPYKFSLMGVKSTLKQVTATLAAPTIVGRKHPSDLITPQRFPGLVR